MKTPREKYTEGVCDFPGGKKSAEAEQIAAALALIAVRLGARLEDRKAA